MKIALSCDHGGFPFHDAVLSHLEKLGHIIVDLSPKNLEPLDDFPDYASQVTHVILNNEGEMGILICGTGIGMSIAANRYKGIRAALVYNREIAKISRSHNDANIACFGARTMTIESVLESIDTFLSEPFIGDKYERRNKKMDHC